MKYRAGDKVTLKNRRGCHWNVLGLMDKYMGQTVTIKNVFDQIAFEIEEDDITFEIEEDDSWTFMFDDIEEAQND